MKTILKENNHITTDNIIVTYFISYITIYYNAFKSSMYYSISCDKVLTIPHYLIIIK